ncbi:patatin-like phospholipase RssA [Shewanella yunxiaonensis]|uniref:Patatin-like phospholipase RssA n=1 Tax=Shewanella yunxiaonensis TaxID=2829809 RepID=A0ABX7YPX5_9GAMM|nr:MULTISPECIES: patatin-like phospholipase RssA [Shewanella]MDF0533593.1 patatin-like phospholipase RssA [Shewanella sp. A32]QUN04657.1 patatin-like phospholipase RssA [Shewanella yunxiaonensis]
MVDASPVIGIALGSGAAKGWAHIGVLKGLAAMGIHPQKIAGCSVGALVGAAYANDRLEELEEWVCSFSSWDVLGLMDISWRRGGLISGDKVFDAIQNRIGDLLIEDLKKPFIAVATDLYSGQEVWFRSGDLRQAVRASCSMPGIMSPVRQGKRWLVDGAVVNPIPVSVSRAMGCQVVIGVDLHGYHREKLQVLPVNVQSMKAQQQIVTETANSEAHGDSGFMDLWAKGKDYVAGLSHKFSRGNKTEPGMLAVMSQSMDILEQRHKRARLVGDPPDIFVVPNVADIGTMEFHHAKEAIAAGEAAVRQSAHLIDAVLGEC